MTQRVAFDTTSRPMVWQQARYRHTLQHHNNGLLLLLFIAVQSVAIAAVYAAADALETIRRHNEEQIMEHYMARASANVTQQFS